MWQVLFGHGWSRILDSVAWEDEVGVRVRVLKDDGTTFERQASTPDLTAEWSTESSYYTFTPALVSSLAVAFMLLGSLVDVLDHVPRGLLAAPRRWRAIR